VQLPAMAVFAGLTPLCRRLPETTRERAAVIQG